LSFVNNTNILFVPQGITVSGVQAVGEGQPCSGSGAGNCDMGLYCDSGGTGTCTACGVQQGCAAGGESNECMAYDSSNLNSLILNSL
jgi:hypothetical protein